MHYISRFVFLILTACVSFYLYYIVFPFHWESKDFFWLYILLVAVLYGSYKLFEIWFIEQQSWFTIYKIVWIFFSQLFLLCLLYFWLTGLSIGLWVFLFLKLTGLLLILSLFWFLIYTLWLSVIKKILDVSKFDSLIVFLMSFGIWFVIFMLWVFIIAATWLYLGLAIAIWILICAGIWYKECIPELSKLSRVTIWNKIDGSLSVERIINEVQVWIISFFLWINFINVYRPFPIGWDDLGVYMNYPKLLSQAWELLPLGKMYGWELFSGIWFLFGSQTYAFLLNSFSWVTVVVIAYVALKYIIWEHKKYFSLPLLGIIVLLMLPMSVFQLAKDMKLDYGLLTFSIIPFTLLYSYISEAHITRSKTRYIYLFIIWILIWFIFTIKVTSLLVLLAGFWMIFYKRFQLSGFFVYFLLFLSIFTFWNLWKIMNVAIDVSSQTRIIISLIFLVLAWVIFWYSYLKNKNILSDYIKITIEIGFLILGFFLILSPWFIKNISEREADLPVSIWYILWWYSQDFLADYSNLYTPNELAQIQSNGDARMNNEWTTNNEDFGRYFGYEEGINNYLKLPFNLSFQLNQKWEFTDISFIFFALLPILFLFLVFKRIQYMYIFAGIIALVFVYYIPSSVSAVITQAFSNFWLPGWYILIVLFYVFPLMYLYYTLEKNNHNNNILSVLSFLSIYLLLWAVSAFWIVWYGIVMYFVFIVLILLLVNTFEHSLESQNQGIKKYSWSLSYIVAWIIAVYLLSSAIPHWITNLKTAWYSDYKIWLQTEEAAVFEFHPDYFNILYNLNLGKGEQNDFFVSSRNKLLEIIDDDPNNIDVVEMVRDIKDIERLFQVLQQLTRYNIEWGLNEDIESLLQEMYVTILYPKQEQRNTQVIYRVGTFLKYFITENSSRIMEDSLLTAFDEYIYDENLDVSHERFRKLWLRYILLDLNAATIDQDPEKRLTQRYEHLLAFLTHPKVELISSDSVCLKLANDVFKDNKNLKSYIELAGVNYGSVEMRTQKVESCLESISRVIWLQKINMNIYFLIKML